MATWINADGLHVNFGPDEAGPARVTEYRTHGPKRFVEIMLDADWLPTAGSISFDEYTLPLNANVERFEVSPETETFAGGTSIAINAVDRDGTSNPVALVTAQTLTNLNGQNSGDLDIQLTAMKRIQVTTLGAAWTTGKGTIRLYFSVPKEESDTLVWDKTP